MAYSKQCVRWSRGLVALMTLFILSSFSSAQQDVLVRQVKDKCIAEWEKRGLFLFSEGIGSRELELLGISLTTSAYAPDKKEARAILVRVMQELLCKINMCRELRPYLACYPFTEKQCILTLFFDDPCTLKPVGEGKIQSVNCTKGHITYVPGGNVFFKAMEDAEEETYAEALLKKEEDLSETRGEQ